MKRPEHYTRSLLICQAGVTITYIVIGCVVYLYCGSYVASPALGSAGHLIKRVAYGYRDDAYFFLKIRAAFPGVG